MINDPIVEEIRRYRKEHAERYGNDLNRIVEAPDQLLLECRTHPKDCPKNERGKRRA